MHQVLRSLDANAFATARPQSLDHRIRHLDYLDGLRALAVSLVLLVHFPFIQGSVLSKGLWDIGQATRGGYIGVDLFFVLSGFLITRILLDEKRKNGDIDLKVFFAKRALRILPIYYICVITATVYFGNNPEALVSLLTFTFNFYHPIHPDPNALEHSWSISVEEQFYLLWPLVITRIPDRYGLLITRYAIPAVSIIIALVLASSLDSGLAARLIYMSGPTRMMSLSLGASLAFRESEGSALRDSYSFGLLGLGVAVLAIDNIGRYLGVVPAGGYYWCLAILGYALVSSSTISLLINSHKDYIGWVRRLLSLRLVRYLGRISYGVYLYHYLILFLMDIPPYKAATTGTNALNVFAALALTLALASFSYHCLERPLLRLKSRLR